MVDSPRVKLLYDIYHMQIMEGDLIRSITEYRQLIGHYHTAGNPGRHEIDGRQEIAYPAVVAAIGALGYAGYLGQEFIPRSNAIGQLRNAFEVCQTAERLCERPLLPAQPESLQRTKRKDTPYPASER